MNIKICHTCLSFLELTNSTYWIVDTDYENYSLDIGCREVAPNGTCIKKDAWLWTRCPSQPQKYVDLMEKQLQRYCITKDMLTTSYQNTGSHLSCKILFVIVKTVSH